MGQTVVTAPDGKKYRVTHPDGASNDEIYRQLQNNLGQTAPQDDGSWQWSDIPRGLAKGVAGIGMDIPGVGIPFVDRVPSVGELDPAAKQWATSSRSGLETGSEWVGAAAPFVAGEIATGGAATPAAATRIATAFGRPALRATGSTIGEIAKSMGWGAASAAAQPTESGTFGSHLEHGAEGAVTALPFAVTGQVLRGASSKALETMGRRTVGHGSAAGIGGALHAAGVPGALPYYFFGPHWYLAHKLGQSWLGDLAAKWAGRTAPAVRGTGQVLQKATPLIGTGVGQAQEDGDAE